MTSLSADALVQLLKDPNVNSEVKELLQREYPPGDELHRLFVEHSWQVTEASLTIGNACGANLSFLREASWLHDIGIKYTHAPGIHCRGDEHYLRHGLIGQALCDEFGLQKHGLVCLRHVGTGISAADVEAQQLPLPAKDMLNESLEERIICYADQFFSKTTGGPHPIAEVRRRTARHGEASLARFEEMHGEFGAHFP